jgi:hypothetical protein
MRAESTLERPIGSVREPLSLSLPSTPLASAPLLSAL